jgi:MoxR-like ATPase
MGKMTEQEVRVECERFRRNFQRLREEVGKAIVGHQEIVDGVLTCLFVGGHALLEGVPGLGKTLLVRTLSEALSLKFNRIQFTPDLMPADIIGTNIVMEDEEGKRYFEFQKGPVFAQIVLADEINRATPKSQSALLEAMQERTVTVGGTIYRLEEPFYVMATQNPIEQEGTYPLPEAQLDRFFYKLVVDYSSRKELHTILNRTTTGHKPDIKAIFGPQEIIEAQELVRHVVIAPHIQDYAIRLTLATHTGGRYALETANQYLRFGASPRGAQAIVLGAKVQALLDGRANVSVEDVKKVYLPAMRHRVILNFEAEAEGLSSDAILQQLLDQVPTVVEAAA